VALAVASLLVQPHLELDNIKIIPTRQGLLLSQFTINVYLGHVVDDDTNLLFAILLAVQDVLEEGGFSCTEEAREDGDWDGGRCVSPGRRKGET